MLSYFVWIMYGYLSIRSEKVSDPDTVLFVWATVGYPASLSENLTQTPLPHTVLAVITLVKEIKAVMHREGRVALKFREHECDRGIILH